MFPYNINFVIILVYFCNSVYTLDSCHTRTTCSDCIRDPSVCVWCAENDFTKTRCRPQKYDEPNWCPTKPQDPLERPTLNATSNKHFSHSTNHVIQIRPQTYKMKLRPGQSQDFEFSFKAVPDYPVDLYFLMDTSKSMKLIQSMAAKQSENIYHTLANMTRNVYLGLGTFVDKMARPFTQHLDPKKTYSFHHRLTLNKDFLKFKDTLSNTPLGENRDPQEGGLDALAQVMSCKDEIGWRTESRKIIVLVTDGPYHAAGDGKLGGIFKPYDGKCYTKNNTYTKELEMDYPSVGMINKLATDGSFTILFYVMNEVDFIYRDLSALISRSQVRPYNKRLTQYNDDYKMVETLKEIYEQISSTIIFRTQVKSGQRKNLEITFQPNCTSEYISSDCNVEIGKEKHFVGTVKLLKYDNHDNLIADVVMESIGEKLTLDIDVINSCECERSDQIEEKSAVCHGERRICGECSCSDKRYGDKCACLKSENNVYNGTDTCNASTCNGHGSCVCGQCECREGYSGTFCECNDASCPRSAKGELCSNRGKCMCGKCVCDSESTTGPACECNVQGCMNNGRICSNRGKCNCDSCQCYPQAEWDKRIHKLDICKWLPAPESHNIQCTVLSESAKCTLRSHAECDLFDSTIQASAVQTLTEKYLNSSKWFVCPDLKLDIGCFTTFVYRYDDDNYSLELIVQKDKNCAQTAYMFGGLVLLVLIVIGIITLVAWKLLTEARDRREYLQFLKMSGPHEGIVQNPLYAEPTSKFDNPGFRKRSFK